MTGLEPLPGKANYFLGNDPAAWRAGVPLFGRVQVHDVYPGIELTYYGNERQLEYDFVVQPGARPDRISIRVEGADQVRVDAAGNLVLKIGEDEVRQHKPLIYQRVRGVKKEVPGGYRLTGETTVGFQVGAYDSDLPLVIDPTLSFSTYLGGKMDDRGWGVAVDPSGNVYIAGETLSRDMATNAFGGGVTNTFQGGTSHFGDAFVAKFAAGTSNLVYLTYLGGKGQDAAFAVAADSAGEAFVTGFTDSPNFPFFPTNAFRTSVHGINGRNNNGQHIYPIDAFVTKLNTNGTLMYSFFLGGNGRDVGMGIALDSAASAYVTGYTESTNFPTTNALQGPYVRGRTPDTITNYFGTNYHGNGDAFVTKISPDGTGLIYSTFLGGTNQEVGESIAVDSFNSAYVAGWTLSTNFPTVDPTNSFLNGLTNDQARFVFFSDAFISKLSADGQSLVYSTLFGAENNDAALHIAVDGSQNAYITGYTYSTNFPKTVTNFFAAFPNSTNAPVLLTNFVSFVSRTNVNADVFVARFNPDGTTNYSIVFGGRSADAGYGIDVDTNGNAYVVGVTASPTNFAGIDSSVFTNFFATTNSFGFTATNSSVRKYGTNDVFLVELDPTGSNFLFSAFIGGVGNDQANGIALDVNTGPGPIAYIVGTTTTTNFPGTAHATFHGSRSHSDAFVGKIQFP